MLAALCVLSIGLVTTVNRAAAALLPPAAGWLADTCVFSMAVCVALYRAIRPARPFAMPASGTSRRRLVWISARWLGLWMTGSVAAALLAGHWYRYRLADGAPQLVGFLFLGPAQEELLFRGAIFELAPRSALSKGRWAPLVVSSLSFSLHHLQLHQYQFTLAALGQMAFALPMGAAFGLSRAESESLWPGFAVHVLTNLPGAFGS